MKKKFSVLYRTEAPIKNHFSHAPSQCPNDEHEQRTHPPQATFIRTQLSNSIQHEP